MELSIKWINITQKLCKHTSLSKRISAWLKGSLRAHHTRARAPMICNLQLLLYTRRKPSNNTKLRTHPPAPNNIVNNNGSQGPTWELWHRRIRGTHARIRYGNHRMAHTPRVRCPCSKRIRTCPKNQNAWTTIIKNAKQKPNNPLFLINYNARVDW